MLLFEEMSKCVERTVKHYKNDFYKHDIEMITECLARHGEMDFIWVCRECGTNLVRADRVCIKDTNDYTEAVYYLDDKSARFYKLHSCSKEDEIHGTIKQMSVDEMIDIKNSARLMSYRDKLAILKDYAESSYWTDEIDFAIFLHNIIDRSLEFGVCNSVIAKMRTLSQRSSIISLLRDEVSEFSSGLSGGKAV